MADVKYRKSSVGAIKKKHRSGLAESETAGTVQASRKKLVEEQAARALFVQAEQLDDVIANTHEPGTRDTVREVVHSMLTHAEPVRATIASKVLGVDEKTVRAWAKAGLLIPVRGRPRVMLEAERLYMVARLVQDLRRAGTRRNLAEAVWRRLQDQGVLEDDQLAESLRQMSQGEGRPWRDIQAEWNSKNSELAPGED
ncbi:hypothetical protein [Sphaerisporangium perillae]|uniref:hypothetical protein n=1 Tax=Sphaerisporangium perillae TaxID=2935860 RepID=UPI00200F99F2|nr:hypothetical protein [Sphaerisporangium perillae]